MSLKTAIKERLASVVTSLNDLKFTDPADDKKALRSEGQKATKGFGIFKDNFEDLAGLTTLVNEIGGIKRADFETNEAFSEALANHRNGMVAMIESMQTFAETLPEGSDSDESNGSLGTRKPYFFPAMKGDEAVSIKANEISTSFKESEILKKHASDPEISLSLALQTHLKEDLGLSWAKPEKGSDNEFYKLYRQIRPAVIRRVKELQANK